MRVNENPSQMETLARWIRQAGIVKAATASAFVMAWAWVAADRERPMNAHAFCDEYGISLATYYRKLKGFREVFPAFSDPGELLARAELEYGDALKWGDLPYDVQPAAATA